MFCFFLMPSFDVPVLFAFLAFPLGNTHYFLITPCLSQTPSSPDGLALHTQLILLSFGQLICLKFLKCLSPPFHSTPKRHPSPTRHEPWSHYGPSYLETRGVPCVSQSWLKEQSKCLTNTELPFIVTCNMECR